MTINNQIPKSRWSSFYKSKYDEWHIGVPVDGSTTMLALAPDGILPGLSKQERQQVGDRIAACLNGCRVIVDPAAVPLLLKSLQTLVNAMPKDGGLVRLDGDELADARTAIHLATGGAA